MFQLINHPSSEILLWHYSTYPRYPAGRVNALIPPLKCVTPPSRGSSDMPSTRPPVQTAMKA